jgi:hypothetical protein
MSATDTKSIVISKPIVAIDVDNTILQYTDSFTKWHNKEYKTEIKMEDHANYNLEQVLGCDRKEVERRIDQFSKTDEYATIPPIPGAMDAMILLDDMDYELVFVTARSSDTAQTTRQWFLFHWRPLLLVKYGCLMPRIIFCSNVQGQSKKKVDVCKELNAVALIDDMPQALRDCVITTPTDTSSSMMKLILFNDRNLYAWAKLEPEVNPKDKQITFCTSWSQIVKQLETE